MNALVLAAGLGTRLRPLTNHIPKPAVSFLNFPIISFPIYFSEFFPVNKLVVNTHHLSSKIRDLFLHPLTRRPVVFSDEQPEILGSAGAISKARSLLDDGDDLLVLNGDACLVNFNTDEFARMLENHRKQKPLASVMVIEHPDVGSKFGGIWVNERDEVVGAGKVRPTKAKKGYHFVSVMILSSSIYSLLPPGRSEIWDILNPELEKGKKVLAHLVKGAWLETGDPLGYLDATKQCLELLASGTDSVIRELSTRYSYPYNENKMVSGKVLLGANVSISNTAKLIGFVVVGDNVQIGDNCLVENSVILESAQIPTNKLLKASLHSRFDPI